ncbi:MAG: hypothetical protein VYE15_02995 [Myxococcota bacterium]|nr:hypothetical protein [Myxococcota bacterium]
MNLASVLNSLLCRWIGVVGLLLITAGSAHAVPSLMGGHTLGLSGQRAARAEVGWPGLKLTYVIPATETLDVSPQFSFRYGQNLRADLVGFEPGVELRWSFWQRGAWTVAVVADPALLLWIPRDGTTGAMGLRLGGPGIVTSWQIARQIQVILGARMPVRLLVAPEASLTVPVLADVGVEVEVVRQEDFTILGYGMMSLGPELCMGECRSSDLTARLSLGASVLW